MKWIVLMSWTLVVITGVCIWGLVGCVYWSSKGLYNMSDWALRKMTIYIDNATDSMRDVLTKKMFRKD